VRAAALLAVPVALVLVVVLVLLLALLLVAPRTLAEAKEPAA
jgi:hypothetical protein